MASGVVVATVLLVLTLFAGGKPPPIDGPLPQPNGYDDLVAAGKLLSTSTADWEDFNNERLRGVLAENQPALTLARQGLAKKCQVPMAYSEEYFAQHVMDIAKMKAIAMALAADGKAAEIANREGDAAKDYATIIKLGVESARGGVLIHRLVDIAIESIGVKHLKAVTSRLTAGECRQCLQILEGAAADQDSFAIVCRREKRFNETAGSFRERIVQGILRLAGRDDMAAIMKKIVPKDIACRRALVEMEGSLAGRAFELENNGRVPKGWEDLAPAYLPGVPNDPTTNGPLPFAAVSLQ